MMMTMMMFSRWLSLLPLWLTLTLTSIVSVVQAASWNETSGKTVMKIALIPKSVDNPFFDSARDGCMDAAAALTRSQPDIEVVCNYTGPSADAEDNEGTLQADIMLDLIAQVDAIAVAVRSVDTLTPVIKDAMQQGVPVVTFDSDAPETPRLHYIGTDNYFFGTQIAKLLKQLQPNGGTFAVVASLESLNLQERAAGFVDELMHDQGVWTPVDLVVNNPYFAMDVQSNITTAMEHMNALALLDPPPTAIAPVMGMPMRSCCWKEFVDTVAKPRNITLVSGDAMPNQIQFLERGYVHGLVGQLPYDFGAMAVTTLFEYWRMQNQDLLPYNNQLNNNNSSTEGVVLGSDGSTTIVQPHIVPVPNPTLDEIMFTNVITLVQVPLILPPLVVNHNLLNALQAVGFVLCAIIMAMAIGFSTWVFTKRHMYVVKVAQPGFLIMVALGTIVLVSALIPLSFDDDYYDGQPDSERQTTTEATAMCMSIPWLASTGFTITFSALFAKVYRVNSIFHSMTKHNPNNPQNQTNTTPNNTTSSNIGTPRRVTVTARDVLIPFVVLLSLNTIILTLWTVLDPLVYIRQDLPGTDGWNRVIATYASCQSNHVEYYLVPLAIINFSVLVMANWQAYQARQQNIQSEFAESKYIGIAMASLLQAMMSGIPILFVVRQSPQAYYLVLCFMIFIICAVVLLVIFVPKMILVDQARGQTHEQQKQRILQSIIMRNSTVVGTGTGINSGGNKSRSHLSRAGTGVDGGSSNGASGIMTTNNDNTDGAEGGDGDTRKTKKNSKTDQYDSSEDDNDDDDDEGYDSYHPPETAPGAGLSRPSSNKDLYASPLSIMDDAWNTIVVDDHHPHDEHDGAKDAKEGAAIAASNNTNKVGKAKTSPTWYKKKKNDDNNKESNLSFLSEKLSIMDDVGWNTVVERDDNGSDNGHS